MHPALILTAVISVITAGLAIAINTSNTVINTPSYDGVVGLLAAINF